MSESLSTSNELGYSTTEVKVLRRKEEDRREQNRRIAVHQDRVPKEEPVDYSSS
jgi:hypothetical protein